MNINAEKIEAAITEKTKAIMVVHVFGRPSPMREIKRIAEKYDLKIIEDACEAIGAEYENERVGNFGDCGVFAFYPTKQITTGEGGIILTDNDFIAAKCRMMRNQGRDTNLDWFDHAELGYNYRISDINCALGIAQIERIEEILTKRETAARKYHERLKDNPHLILPDIEFQNESTSWFVYVVRLSGNFTKEDRDFVVREMINSGIGCGRIFCADSFTAAFYEKIRLQNGRFSACRMRRRTSYRASFFQSNFRCGD